MIAITDAGKNHQDMDVKSSLTMKYATTAAITRATFFAPAVPDEAD